MIKNLACVGLFRGAAETHFKDKLSVELLQPSACRVSCYQWQDGKKIPVWGLFFAFKLPGDPDSLFHNKLVLEWNVTESSFRYKAFVANRPRYITFGEFWERLERFQSKLISRPMVEPDLAVQETLAQSLPKI